jgi:site-specific recombinase XerD
MAGANRKLTKRTIDSLEPDKGGRDVTYFDTELRGFGVRVKPSGAKAYVLKYRNKFGQQRKYTIGRVGDGLTPEKAREKAEKLRAGILDGADPAGERKAMRSAITVAELCDEYLEEGKTRFKGSTLIVDTSRIERHVKPLLGTRAVASLTRADMEKFLRDVMTGKTMPKEGPKGRNSQFPRGGRTRGGPSVASRTLGMLGTILQRAVNHGVIERNPARGIARPKESPYKPAFSFQAVSAVGKAMREMEPEGENVAGLRAIRFLMLTGCRRMEALTLNWKTVDRTARCLRFEDTKTGKQIRPIGRSALAFLASFEPKDATGDAYVFPGPGKAGYFVGLPKVWARVAKRAKVADVSIHGLRHWFASAATEMNYSELTIAGLLGHTVKGVTARYATAPDSALLAAADRVSQRIAEVLDGGPVANVLTFPGGQHEQA